MLYLPFALYSHVSFKCLWRALYQKLRARLLNNKTYQIWAIAIYSFIYCATYIIQNYFRSISPHYRISRLAEKIRRSQKSLFDYEITVYIFKNIWSDGIYAKVYYLIIPRSKHEINKVLLRLQIGKTGLQKNPNNFLPKFQNFGI